MGLEINPHMHPPGGYVFPDGDGHLHQANSWKSLLFKVADYRGRNSRPPGNPWDEIVLYHCADRPSYCREVGRRQGPASAQARPSHQLVKDKIVQWFVNIIKLKRDKKLPRVDDVSAAARAEICRRCSQQTGISEVCASCTNGIKTGRKAILEGQNSRHQNLRFCAALGEDTTISVHIEQAKVANPALPANCWRKA